MPLPTRASRPLARLLPWLLTLLALPAAQDPPLAGTWVGAVNGKDAAGERVRAQARLVLRADEGGGYAAELVLESRAEGRELLRAALEGAREQEELRLAARGGAPAIALALKAGRLSGALEGGAFDGLRLRLERALEVAELIGSWRGTGRDEAEDGAPLEYPLELELSAGAGGRLVGALRATVQYPVGPGQTLAVELSGRFTGRPEGAELELEAPDVVATAQGQRESIGAQTLRLKAAGEGALEGRLGNARDGWTPVELRRVGAPPELRSGAERERAPEPAAAPHAPTSPAPDGPVVLEPATLRDPGMDGMVSHTLLVPKGWQVRGGQRWTPQSFRDFVHLDLRVSAPDGRELAVYPGGFYEDSNVYELIARMGGVSQRPQPGQVLMNGLTHMPLPESASAYVVEQLLPRHRPEARELRVLSAREVPELATQMRELMAPVLETMERNNAQLRGMGMVGGDTMSFVAERVHVAYLEQGREYEEELWVLGSVNRNRQAMQGELVEQVHWNMLDPRGVRAPAGQLERARPLLEAISLSIRQDPRYAAVILDLQARIGRQQLEALQQRGEIARRGREEAWRIHQEGVRAREASNERTHELYTEMLRDVDRYQDLDGQLVELPSLYSDVYSDGEGGYLLSNDPTFDPNDNSTVRWQRIDPRR